MLLSTMTTTASPSSSSTQQQRPRHRYVFYSAWFCPYAQRVWMALNEHSSPMMGTGNGGGGGYYEYELVEALGSGLDASYTKHPDLLACNPNGLVPTLVRLSRDSDSENGDDDQEEVMCESIDILDHLEQHHQGADSSSIRQQQSRKDADDWNRRICSTFYRVLMTTPRMERDAAWDELTRALVEFSEHLPASDDDDDRGFYDGHDRPGIVAWTVFPFVARLFVLEHYRGYSLSTTGKGEAARRLGAWQARMEARPAVAQTMADPTKLLDIYQQYADGTTTSKVGTAVQQGKEAHTV